MVSCVPGRAGPSWPNRRRLSPPCPAHWSNPQNVFLVEAEGREEFGGRWLLPSPQCSQFRDPQACLRGKPDVFFYLYLLCCWEWNPGAQAHKPRALPLRCLTGQEQHGNTEKSERESWTPKTVQLLEPLTFFSPPLPRPGEMGLVCVRCVGWG